MVDLYTGILKKKYEKYKLLEIYVRFKRTNTIFVNL